MLCPGGCAPSDYLCKSIHQSRLHNWLDVSRDLVISVAVKVVALVSASLRIPPSLFLSLSFERSTVNTVGSMEVGLDLCFRGFSGGMPDCDCDYFSPNFSARSSWDKIALCFVKRDFRERKTLPKLRAFAWSLISLAAVRILIDAQTIIEPDRHAAVCTPGVVFQTQMGFRGQRLFLKLETNQGLSLLHAHNRSLRQTSFTVAKSPAGAHN